MYKVFEETGELWYFGLRWQVTDPDDVNGEIVWFQTEVKAYEYATWLNSKEEKKS